MTLYEMERAANIERNRIMVVKLGLIEATKPTDPRSDGAIAQI